MNYNIQCTEHLTCIHVCTLLFKIFVPNIIFLLTLYGSGGLQLEGIYRISPSIGDINKLKSALNTGEYFLVDLFNSMFIVFVSDEYVYVYVYVYTFMQYIYESKSLRNQRE